MVQPDVLQISEGIHQLKARLRASSSYVEMKEAYIALRGLELDLSDVTTYAGFRLNQMDGQDRPDLRRAVNE